MKLIERVMKEAKFTTSYQLAKAVGVPTQLVDRWRGKVKASTPGGMQFKYLIRLKELSGKSWGEFGKWLEDEFKE